jgi:hypothetical protein
MACLNKGKVTTNQFNTHLKNIYKKYGLPALRSLANIRHTAKPILESKNTKQEFQTSRDTFLHTNTPRHQESKRGVAGSPFQK